jgi:GntR family transcriptional regulator/MocR family aminotransferase
MIIIDTKSKIPLYEQLYQQIKEQILSGQLTANQKLPTTRELAADYMISRNTVINAYSQLEVEGFIKSIGGSGYYVEQLNFVPPISPNPSFSYANDIVYTENIHSIYDFQYGDLDYNCYKIKAWRKCITDAFDKISLQTKLSYDSPQGLLDLRRTLSNYLYISRGVKCSPDQIIITSGHQYSLSIIANIFSSENWIFAMEDPGYNGTHTIFKQNNYSIIPVPVENDGILVPELQQLQNTLLYITPSHQFPMGSILSIAKRLAILNWAGNNNGYIIEDDYDSELRYNSLPIASLQSIDRNNRTIYLGTFSKSLSPDLRIAFLVLPETLLPLYREKYQLVNCSVPSFLQIALTDFMLSGNYQKHINTLRTHFKKKYRLIINLLKKNNSSDITIHGSDTGSHFILSINTDLDQQAIIDRFAKNNIRVYPTDIYWINKCQCPKNQILVGFGSIPIENISKGMELFLNTLNDISFKL